MSDLEPVTRPNGKVYHPRVLRTEILYDEDAIECQILVLGTHDIDRAQVLAEQVRLSDWFCTENPCTGWWRQTVRNYDRYWEYDETRGAAGVSFDICYD